MTERQCPKCSIWQVYEVAVEPADLMCECALKENRLTKHALGTLLRVRGTDKQGTIHFVDRAANKVQLTCDGDREALPLTTHEEQPRYHPNELTFFAENGGALIP